MTNKRESSEDAQVRALKERLLLMVSFFENAQPFPSGRRLRELILTAASTGRLRELRLIAREIETMMIALTPDQRDGLEALLRSHLGVDVELEGATAKYEAMKILQRGRIVSEKERLRVERYLDLLIANGANETEVQMFLELLNKS